MPTPRILLPKYDALSGAQYPCDIDESCAALFRALHSVKLSTWTERANPKSVDLHAVTWSGFLSLFVAVGAADGADAYIVTSSDGHEWTERANPKNFALRAVAWSPALDLFCAVGVADGVDAYLITSPDGTNWTERTNPKNVDLNGVAWSQSLGLFVAVGSGDGVDAYLITSPDGTNWTERANPKNVRLNAVAANPFGDGIVAVGDNDGGGSDAYLITSSDGIIWAERQNPLNLTLRGVAYSFDLGMFAAVGASNYVITSDDAGVTWVRRTDLPGVGAGEFRAVAWVNPAFVAVGDSTSGKPGYVVSSFDGAAWTFRGGAVPASGALALFGVAYGSPGDTGVCLVGDADATDAHIARSADLY